MNVFTHRDFPLAIGADGASYRKEVDLNEKRYFQSEWLLYSKFVARAYLK